VCYSIGNFNAFKNIIEYTKYDVNYKSENGITILMHMINNIIDCKVLEKNMLREFFDIVLNNSKLDLHKNNDILDNSIIMKCIKVIGDILLCKYDKNEIKCENKMNCEVRGIDDTSCSYANYPECFEKISDNNRMYNKNIVNTNPMHFDNCQSKGKGDINIMCVKILNHIISQYCNNSTGDVCCANVNGHIPLLMYLQLIKEYYMNDVMDMTIVSSIITSPTFDIDTIYYDGKNIIIKILDNLLSNKTYCIEDECMIDCLRSLLQKYPMFFTHEMCELNIIRYMLSNYGNHKLLVKLLSSIDNIDILKNIIGYDIPKNIEIFVKMSLKKLEKINSTKVNLDTNE
jgi:hypothetical protein